VARFAVNYPIPRSELTYYMRLAFPGLSYLFMPTGPALSEEKENENLKADHNPALGND